MISIAGFPLGPRIALYALAFGIAVCVLAVSCRYFIANSPISAGLVAEYALPGEGDITGLDFAGDNSNVLYWARLGKDLSGDTGSGTLGKIVLEAGRVDVLLDATYSFSGVASPSEDEWIATTREGFLLASYSSTPNFVIWQSDSELTYIARSKEFMLFGTLSGEVFEIRTPNLPVRLEALSIGKPIWHVNMAGDTVVVSDPVVVFDRVSSSSQIVRTEWMARWVAYSAGNGYLAIGQHDEVLIGTPSQLDEMSSVRRIPADSAKGVWYCGTNYMILALRDGQVVLVDGDSGKMARLIGSNRYMFLIDHIDAIAVNSYGTRLAIGRRSGKLSIYELTSSGIEATLMSTEP